MRALRGALGYSNVRTGDEFYRSQKEHRFEDFESTELPGWRGFSLDQLKGLGKVLALDTHLGVQRMGGTRDQPFPHGSVLVLFGTGDELEAAAKALGIEAEGTPYAEGRGR